MEQFRDWIFGEYGGRYPEALPPDDDGPLYQRHHDQAFWSEAVKKPAGFYVGYNEVRRTSGSKTIDELAAAVTSAATADPARPIVIDLRNNGGGDNNTYGPLRRAVEAAAHATPGSVRLITGRATFSAAGNFVTDLLVGPEKAGIRLIGEPPGGGLDIYGDVKVVTLPASKIVVLISARYHERAPGDPRLALHAGRPGRGQLGRLCGRPRPGPRGGAQALRPRRQPPACPAGDTWGRRWRTCGSSSRAAAARADRGSCATCASMAMT